MQATGLVCESEAGSGLDSSIDEFGWQQFLYRIESVKMGTWTWESRLSCKNGNSIVSFWGVCWSVKINLVNLSAYGIEKIAGARIEDLWLAFVVVAMYWPSRHAGAFSLCIRWLSEIEAQPMFGFFKAVWFPRQLLKLQRLAGEWDVMLVTTLSADFGGAWIRYVNVNEKYSRSFVSSVAKTAIGEERSGSGTSMSTLAVLFQYRSFI